MPTTATGADADSRRARVVRIARTLAILTIVAVIAAPLARYMLILDRMTIYFPERSLAATPDGVGLAYEDVHLTAADGVRLHGWHIPGESNVTLLWFHGNSGNISHRLDNVLALNRILGVGVFILDYRGYGLSEGRPSEKGLYLDAEAALEYATTELGLDAERDVVLFGRSLGAGVAVEMATRHRVRGVIIESGFTSVRGMAKRADSPLPAFLILPLLEARYDSISKIGRIQSPVLVLHGDRDDIVPFEMAEELFAAAPEPKRFYPIRGASHNDTYAAGGESYFDALREFVFP